MDDVIKIPQENVALMQGVIDQTVCVRVNTMEALDNIIEQCRNIKLRWLGEQKNGNV